MRAILALALTAIPAVAVADDDETPSAANWPKAYVERPLNAPKGMFELTPTFAFYRIKTDDGMGGVGHETTTSINARARYGINERLEAIVALGGTSVANGLPEHGLLLTADDSDARFKATLHVGVGRILLTGKLDAEVKGGLVYDPRFGNSALTAGVDVRLHVTEKLWVGTPVDRTGLFLGLTHAEVNELEVGGSKPIRFSIPIAIAYQATSELALQINTRVVDFNLNADAKGPSDKAVTLFGSDELGAPLDIDVVYALSHHRIDVVGNLNLVDLKNAGDSIVIAGGINVRF